MQGWPQIHGSSYIYISTFALSAIFQLGFISPSLVHYDLPVMFLPQVPQQFRVVSANRSATTIQSRQNFITHHTNPLCCNNK